MIKCHYIYKPRFCGVLMHMRTVTTRVKLVHMHMHILNHSVRVEKFLHFSRNILESKLQPILRCLHTYPIARLWLICWEVRVLLIWLTLSLLKAIKGVCKQCRFRWESSLWAVSPEICNVCHLDITFYQISCWMKSGVVQFSTWKSRLCERVKWNLIY